MTKKVSRLGMWCLGVMASCTGYGPSDYINNRRAMQRLARQGYAEEVSPQIFAITDPGREYVERMVEGS